MIGNKTTVKAALDELYDKAPKYHRGDIVPYGGETFYVLNESNTTVELMTKTNINTDSTAQVKESYETTKVAFCSSSEYNSYTSLETETSNLNLNNVNGFSDGSALGRARKYARMKGAISGRLLTYQEADSLKETYPAMIWGYGNTAQTENDHGFERWWLGTRNGANSTKVWRINGDVGQINISDYSDSGNYGVRPVITVYKSEILPIVDHTITFNANGGSFDDDGDENSVSYVWNEENGEYDTTTGSYKEPTLEGKWFLGWSKVQDATTATYSDESSAHTLAGTLYAIWETRVTINFNSNGGYFSGNQSLNSVTYGNNNRVVNGEVKTPTRSYYILSGWNTAANGSGTSYNSITAIPKTSELTVYAQWEKEMKWINFRGQKGSISFSLRIWTGETFYSRNWAFGMEDYKKWTGENSWEIWDVCRQNSYAAAHVTAYKNGQYSGWSPIYIRAGYDTSSDISYTTRIASQSTWYLAY